MRTRMLGNTGLTSSVLGFGCSGIMGRAGRKNSLRALAAAWDAGITFYDTARSYGYGESETLLGEFLRTRRQNAIISTKFGILASRQTVLKRVAKPVARALLSVVPAARGLVRKRAAAEFTANQFNVAVLEQSLNESLRKLQTDYVDVLFMHEAPADVLQNDELLHALDKLVRSGKVRVLGISSTPAIVESALNQPSTSLRAAQFPFNLLDCSAGPAAAAIEQAGWLGVANQPFGGVGRVQQCREILGELAKVAPAELRSKLSQLDNPILADVVLNFILETPGIHVAIPAMMQAAHLHDNVNAVTQSRFSAAERDWMRASITRRFSLANGLTRSH